MDEPKFGEVCSHGSLKRKCELCERDAVILQLGNHVVCRDITIRKLKVIIKRMVGFVDMAELYHDFLDKDDGPTAKEYLNLIGKIENE